MKHLHTFALALSLVVTTPVLARQQPDTPPAKKTATLQLDHISVEVRGERGTPVVLIPGLSSPRAAWEETAQSLIKNHKVHLVQINGFGGDDPRRNLEGAVLDGVVRDLKQYIERSGLRRVSVVGHSMGGLVGLMLAARHPTSIDRLMTVDALPFFAVTMAPSGVEVTPAMVAPQAEKMRDAVATGYGKPADPVAAAANVAGMTLNPVYRSRLTQWAMGADPRVAAQVLYEDLTTDMRPELKLIRVPVTVVYAWNDTYPLKARADTFFRANFAGLTNGKFVGLGPSAHFVMFDQAEPFQRVLHDFLL